MDDGVAPPEDVDVLESGPPRRRRWAIVAACVVVLVGVGSWRAATGRHGSGDSGPSPTVSSSADSPAAWPTPTPTPGPPPRELTADLSWLDAVTDYSLFLRTDDAVYRLQPRAGGGVRTPVPGLLSSGPVSFVPVEREVLIRPLDSVPSYRVPDDGPARPTANSDGGVLLPGPDPRHVWVTKGSSDDLTLAGIDGRPSGTATIVVPHRRSVFQAVPDGQGYLIAADLDRFSDLRPGTPPVVVDGTVLAVGQSRLLVRRCTGRRDCRVVVLDRTFAPLPAQPRQRIDPLGLVTGVVSPDGRWAALTGVGNQPVTLIDLISGAIRRTDAVPRHSGGWDASGQLEFSPDSRWLFVAGVDQVRAVDPASGTARTVLPGAAAVEQLAVRP